MHKKCVGCGGRCCEYLLIPTFFSGGSRIPVTEYDFEICRWILLRGLPLNVKPNLWSVRVQQKCTKVSDDGLCTIHETKPLPCKNFNPDPWCPKDGPERGMWLRTVEDLDAYKVAVRSSLPAS